MTQFASYRRLAEFMGCGTVKDLLQLPHVFVRAGMLAAIYEQRREEQARNPHAIRYVSDGT